MGNNSVGMNLKKLPKLLQNILFKEFIDLFNPYPTKVWKITLETEPDFFSPMQSASSMHK